MSTANSACTDSRSASAVDEPLPPLEGAAEDYIYQEWLDFGFDPLEALSLLSSSLSPSQIREFLRHNPTCDVRTAVAIFL